MPSINLFPPNEDQSKLSTYANYEQSEQIDGEKTRNSTFSKASEGREEIQKNLVNIYETAFI